MKPIGLAIKNKKTNCFTDVTSGELMLVHFCLNCGKISRNRIAGDDNSYVIVRLLEETKWQDIKTDLDRLNIKLLTQKDEKLVLTVLYGYEYENYISKGLSDFLLPKKEE